MILLTQALSCYLNLRVKSGGKVKSKLLCVSPAEYCGDMLKREAFGMVNSESDNRIWSFVQWQEFPGEVRSSQLAQNKISALEIA